MEIKKKLLEKEKEMQTKEKEVNDILESREKYKKEVIDLKKMVYNNQREFIDFVLRQYMDECVGELDDQKLPELIELKYGTVTDGQAVLGEDIRDKFIDFQQHLYAA